MKNLFLRRNLVFALMACMLLVPLVAAGWYVVVKHKWAEEQLSIVEPRYARVLGIELGQADLEAALDAARAQAARYAYPESLDVTQAGNDAQQRVRSLFTAAGLQIVSSQVLAPKTENGFDRIPMAVRSEGELMGVQAALIGLTDQVPVILVDGVSVQTIGAVKAEVPQRLAIQFNLSVLRVHP